MMYYDILKKFLLQEEFRLMDQYVILKQDGFLCNNVGVILIY